MVILSEFLGRHIDTIFEGKHFEAIVSYYSNHDGTCIYHASSYLWLSYRLDNYMYIYGYCTCTSTWLHLQEKCLLV